MPRVKGGVHALKRRRKILGRAKGFRFGRGTKESAARDALSHAGAYSFAHRKDKKSDRRRLWQVKINAGSRAEGISFSKLMGALKKKNVGLNRKILAELAEFRPETFKKVIAHAK
ncbi:MAG TPA: 50S ribosomal protein L20 [Candidatus Paceibacterota bacterium]|nr:50S ribosomal protein L20 [Candidatus Paceibacterota bacterium]MBP9852141.1 50S ribosomal protein L20 [Candidatus Paceibacterota bacterium]HRH31629.1 50S ribosomal protein L20 [Candidatus Paceibacterota bacterium]